MSRTSIRGVATPERLPGARPLAAGRRRTRESRELVAAESDPAPRTCPTAPAVRGRRLRRLLLVGGARRRTSASSSGPARSRCCRTGAICRSAITAAPARWSSAAPTSSARAARQAARRRRADLRPHAEARHRARARLRRRHAEHARRARPDRRRARPRLRRRARQRLERARHPGLGVPAARPVPRQVVRDVDLAVGHAARRAAAASRAPPQDPEPLDYLRTEPWAYDIDLEVVLNGESISRTNTRHLYWNVEQQVAHLTSNGASLRTGDLLASGTISGSDPGSFGSLIELTWNGERPLSSPTAPPAPSSRTATKSCSAAPSSAKFADASRPAHRTLIWASYGGRHDTQMDTRSRRASRPCSGRGRRNSSP